MPLSLSRLTSNRAAAVIDFGDGDVLHVEYYPAKITGKMMADLAGTDAKALVNLPAEKAVALINSPTDILTSLLASWDLVDDPDDGSEATPIPLDRTHIEALGISIQWAILNGVMSAQGEAKAPEAPSMSAPPSDATS